MLFLGAEALADGFRLIGFETYPDPSAEDAERVLREILRERDSAFVIVDDALMRADIPALRQARREGGRIVIVSVPPLSAAPKLESEVAARLAAMFGNVNGG